LRRGCLVPLAPRQGIDYPAQHHNLLEMLNDQRLLPYRNCEIGERTGRDQYYLSGLPEGLLDDEVGSVPRIRFNGREPPPDRMRRMPETPAPPEARLVLAPFMHQGAVEPGAHTDICPVD